MADSKRCRRQLRGRHSPFLVVLVGFLWMGIAWPGGHVDGQTTKGQPAQSQILIADPVTVTQIPPAVRVLTQRIAFHFVINPDTPLKDLLPVPPKAQSQFKPLLVEDLSQVPEVAFQEPLAKTPEALKLTAHTMAKINHLNRQKTDGFMEALLGARPDLAGLPVAMGGACRMTGDRNHYFTEALATIKRAKGQGSKAGVQEQVLRREQQQLELELMLAREMAVKQKTATDQAIREKVKETEKKSAPPVVPAPPAPDGVPQPVTAQALEDLVLTSFNRAPAVAIHVDPDAFWSQYRTLCAQEDNATSKLGQSLQEQALLARIAALMQVLAPDSVAMRKGLVQYLASISHAEATRALAKLAIFSAEDEVRNPAIEALKVRREKDYTEILLRGLRYPLPAVAKRTTDAMIKLERADLVPELVSFLEEPDPRAPTIKEMGEKKVAVVRELVRINHHRNCLMCHAPAVPNEVSPQVTTAEVPRPDQPLPFPSDGYSNSIPDILVRLDVTYLRQDFSIMQPVADAHPWPEMQRFDFLVRNRELTTEEATAFPAAKAGVLSPYQRVTLAALRELTGRDTAPTPDAWRKLLDMPARAARTSLQ
jgi:hypothetical protein